MKNDAFYYSVGPLLYSPANRESIADSIIHQRFGTNYSLALCLEDTIRDDRVAEAEQTLVKTLHTLCLCSEYKEFYLPKLFVRVRHPAQIGMLYKQFGDASRLVTGFILPKFSLENADGYLHEIRWINEHSQIPVYVMPIYESASIIDLRSRYDILYALKEKLATIEDRVLNIRVGGNDLCHMFGFRRHENESIHQIRPVADIFSDIITVYGMDYIISGPVWEYYNGSNWKQGMMKETIDDRICGFVGKTVIHPNQIEVVNEAYKVSEKDYTDACAILHWDTDTQFLVSASAASERMNEYKTHSNWALRTLFLAETFGVKHNSSTYCTDTAYCETAKISSLQVQPYLYHFHG